MSLNQPIASAVSTGTCRIGAKSSIDAIKKGEAKLVVVAANCPKNEADDIQRYANLSKIKIQKFEGTSWDLGEVVGKPFMVSAIAIIKPGDSKILKMV
jgi:large subunit ribosomal protein L30e